jgi:DNA topoisomerase VI subunit B
MSTVQKVATNTQPQRRLAVIQTGQALESLRDSGHSLPTALGEVIDNSIEAKANHIAVRLDDGVSRDGRKHIHRIAIADDGSGMDPDILHHYLVIGYSTRYMRTDTIGKYGVGAKLAALNFGRRIDVWSRDDARADWLHVHFDLDEAINEEKLGETAGLDAPTNVKVPDDLRELLPEGTGTLVIWSRVDRLEEGRWAENSNELRLDLERELARIFRYFINGGIKISVNGKELIAHDPLMRMEGTWSDYVLTRENRKNSGDKRSRSEKIESFEHFPATVIGEEEIKIGRGKAKVIVTLYPKEVIRKRGVGGDNLAKELRVPDNEGVISFVRKSREVSYTIVPRILPGGVKEQDRFIGIEVTFNPDLDNYFGIRNVKRGVEPHGDLRDKVRTYLKGRITTARNIIDEVWGKVSREEQETTGEHTSILEAVKEVDVTMPKGRAEDDLSPSEVEKALEELANDVLPEDVSEKEKEAYLNKIKSLPHVVESVDFPGNMFISTQHLAGKVIIRLNTRHPFYREMWEPIKLISQRDAGTVSGEEAVSVARRTIEALTLLLIAYGKAESMDSSPAEKYGDLTQYWGQFLSTMLNKVKNVL